MKKNWIINSLAFRILVPVIATTLILFAGLYFFVLRSVSDFADSQIRESLSEMSRDIHHLCDMSLQGLLRSGEANNEAAVRIEKGRTLGRIEDFMNANGLEGTIYAGDMEIMVTSAFPREIPRLVEKRNWGTTVLPVTAGGKRYYASRLLFQPWEWEVVFVKNASSFSSLLRRVSLAYGITGALFLLATIFLLLYLQRTVGLPIKRIIAAIRRGVRPDYQGISEFEFLSASIAQMEESLRRETVMLNNIYHIAASKQGEDFFDEVAMAISRLFGMHSLIARINPGGESERVISMYLKGEIQKGMDIVLKGTPCEDLVQKRHIAVIERDACRLFPSAKLLTSTKAESFFGLAIFDRRGEVIGVLNAFGSPREFTESDIKVLQTIGQIVATEFQRIDEEKEKEDIRNQLFQAQKMDAIGNLAGGIAHDFNNMLQGILGSATLLKMQITESDKAYRSIELIEHIADRASQLTRQLLGFARKGKYIVEPLDLNSVVENVLKIISRTFDRSISINTSLRRDLWTMEGDRSQIEQVMLNLCLNARDAMPSGGTLTIETFNSPDIPAIDGGGRRAGEYAAVRITDSGVGMDDETKKRIFEPFFTTKGVGKGTGMGLAMVYGVVKNHRGAIAFESTPGRGSIFTVFFPAVHAEVPVRKESDGELIYGKGTVLVVDDEDIVRDISREILEKLGYSVLEASNGLEAVELYGDRHNEVDLVLLDLVMPVMDGREAFERLRKINPGVKVLFSSGYDSDKQSGLSSMSSGARGFIRKPFTILELAEKVNRLAST